MEREMEGKWQVFSLHPRPIFSRSAPARLRLGGAAFPYQVVLYLDLLHADDVTTQISAGSFSDPQLRANRRAALLRDVLASSGLRFNDSNA